MFPRALSDRVETLIDDLIEEGGLASGSFASILLAARDAVQHGYGLEFSRRVRLTLEELRHCDLPDANAHHAPRPAESLSPSRQAS